MRQNLSNFDRDMLRVLRYHERLVRLCQALAAINVDGDLFNKLAPKALRKFRDNQQIRWRLEDRIRALLKRNGDWPDQQQSKPRDF